MNLPPLLPFSKKDDTVTPQPSLLRYTDSTTNRVKKRSHNSTACEGCKQARVKCSGPPAPCGPCAKKSAACIFRTDLDQRRKLAVRRKIEGTELYRGLLEKLINVIQESNDSSIQHVIDVIRGGHSTDEDLEEIGSILRQLQNDEPLANPIVKTRKTAFEETIELLKNLPETDAQEVLRKIRSGVDPITILNHFQTGDVLLQMALTPETRFRYEFPYRSQMPRDLVRSNPYLDSSLYESMSVYPDQQRTNNGKQSLSNREGTRGSEAGRSPYLKPFHAAQVVEPRLSDVKVSRWTAVCSDDTLMRRLLRGFFQCEYQFTAAFQKDLFLEDMDAQRKDFCSSLLVNAVLAYSCICDPRISNRSEYWDPSTLTYRFLAEAKRIWELESDTPLITTIQAGIVFTVLHNLCGLDEIGAVYRIKAVALAHRVHLFDNTMEGDDRLRHGRAFTAWALYNWETLSAFSFMLAPLITRPPEWPLPDSSKDVEWFGETWLRYPLHASVLPSNFNHILRARCQFRIIMNEFCQVAYSSGPRITLIKARQFYDQLKRWHDGLPGPLTAREIVFPSHLQLHIYYHHLILTIFEPLINIETDIEPIPQQVVADAKRYLQVLVRLYYLRHGFEAMDLFIVIPLMLTGYDCIDTINRHNPDTDLEELRSTLILVAHGLYTQRRNHYLAEALFRVIRGRMRFQEVVLLRRILYLDEDEADAKQEMPQTVRSRWPVSIVTQPAEMDSYILGNLVENYAHLNTESA